MLQHVVFFSTGTVQRSRAYLSHDRTAPFHRPDYAALTLAIRDRENPGDLFDRLTAMNLVTIHADEGITHEHITAHAQAGEAITVATNDEATELNERICAGRVERGEVDSDR